jgi:cytochrome P450
MIDRVALDDDEICGVHIPAGLTVVPYIYGMHRNPEVWDDPESYDPLRFEDHAKGDRNPFAFIPFGGGPRKCIGSNMGMMQMLLVLATVVRRYEFELVTSDPIPIEPMFILRPKGAIEMRVRRRARTADLSVSRR